MKIWPNLIKPLILILCIYAIAGGLWRNFVGIPKLRSEGPNHIAHHFVFTSDQISYFNHLLNLSELINTAAAATFVILCLMGLVGGSLYWIKRRKTKHAFVQFIKTPRRHLQKLIVTLIILFFAIIIVTAAYPTVYLLKIQNDQFLNELGSLRGDNPNNTNHSAFNQASVAAAEVSKKLQLGIVRDRLRSQIRSCWDIPLNLSESQKTPVEIIIDVNPDYTIRAAHVVDQDRLAHDSGFRILAESALAALRKPECSHLDLPRDQYDSWKEIHFGFDPNDVHE